MNIRNQQGFTIVELLIVIVVIAILATISIVAYNGIQNRARTSAAQTAAANSVKKLEIYNADKTGYPATFSLLTGAASTETFKLDGVTFQASITSAPSTPSTVTYERCGVRTSGNNTAPAALGDIATTTGARIVYWSWQDNAVARLTTGIVTGTVGTQNVGCFATAS